MWVTAVWVAVLVAAVMWEVFARFHRKWASLSSLASRLWLHPFGRVFYVVIWAFLAWHVFTRYTIPH